MTRSWPFDPAVALSMAARIASRFHLLRHEAEDLAQAAVLRVLQRADRLPAAAPREDGLAGGDLAALWVALRSAMIDEIRSGTWHRWHVILGHVGDTEVHVGPGPDDMLAEKEAAREIHAAIRALPLPERVAIADLMADAAPEDTAGRMGVSPARVHQLRWQARARLRKRLSSGLQRAAMLSAYRAAGPS